MIDITCPSSIELPLAVYNTNIAEDLVVDWGDGTSLVSYKSTTSEAFQKFTHTFPASGTYRCTFDMNAEISRQSSFLCLWLG